MSFLICHHGARASLMKVDDKTYLLHSVFAKELGKGYGREVVQMAVDKADERGYTLKLRVQEFRHPHGQGLNNQQLEAFYEKFGFVRELNSDRRVFMTRPPRGQN
jgi:GNAT superfamily N-acetyltransferase